MTARLLHGRRPDLLGALALVLALPGLWLAPRVFFACWLAAWWFWTGLALGALANTWIHALTGGRWGVALGLAARPLGRALPWLLLAFLPLAGGATRLWPWADAGWTSAIEAPGFQLAWYAPGVAWPRLAAIGVLWCVLARAPIVRRKGRAAAALIALLFTGTLVAWDLVMALVPGWMSAGHGLVELAGAGLGGAALAVALAAARAPDAFPVPAPRPARTRTPPVWRDLGNLLLMWTMLWAYVAFMEFLVIWAENLPHEVRWFVPRLTTGWADVGLARALAGLQFGLPLCALLWRANKDAPRRLARIAGGLCAGQLLNCAWLVLPSVDAHALAGWWLLPLLALAPGLPLVARCVRVVDAAAAAPAARQEPAHA